jgi:hypothetical protein
MAPSILRHAAIAAVTIGELERLTIATWIRMLPFTTCGVGARRDAARAHAVRECEQLLLLHHRALAGERALPWGQPEPVSGQTNPDLQSRGQAFERSRPLNRHSV